MTTVTLKFKTEEGIKKVQHEIERIKLVQFTQTLVVVKDVLVMLNEDGALKDLLEMTFGQEIQTDGLDEKAVEEMMKNLDSKFLVSAVEAFKELATSVPEKFNELLSILSGIPKAELEQQDLFDVLDIFDAVFEVNDIEALINRVKKSLGATIGKMKFMQLRKKATA